jgi:HTH-type transcriptional regulator / antitoxin HipB
MHQLPLRIGKIVRFHRKKAKLTQAELAKYAGIGKTAVFDLEKGKASIQLSTLLAILNVLNIQIIFKSPIMHLLSEVEE